MPAALPLLAAAGSVSAGVAAVGAATTMAGTIIGGAMIAGGVMTGLGALTGNKKLMKWGGIIGLAGGVAGLATNAWSTASSSLAEQAAKEGFRAAELAAQSAGDLAGAASGALGGAAQSAGGMLQGLDLGAINVGGVQGAPMTPGINGAAPPIAMPTAPGIPSTVNLVNAGGTQATAGGASGMLDVFKQKVADLGASSGVGGQQGMLGRSMEWMEKNPRITQAGAGLLQAGLGAYGQQEAVKQQIKDQEAAAARRRQRMSDSIAGVSVPVYQRAGG